MHHPKHRIVITGIGAVTPLGLDAPSTWQALIAGKSGVSAITAFDPGDLPTKIAAFVKGFDPHRYMDRRDVRRVSPFVHYAVAAAQEAMAHARLDLSQEDPLRVGVEIGSALGGTNIVEEQRAILETKGVRAIAPTTVPGILINMASCTIAIQHGIKGPVSSPVAACATGSVALGDAARKMCHGEADVIIAGGADSVMTELAIAGFSRLGALSTKNDTPEQACAPFDIHRDGTVVGEGAAALVLETLEHAQARGAPILAELLGYGLTCDAFHMIMPDTNGDGAARAMNQALRSAGRTREDVDWICAHGTATPLNDISETRAIKTVLGERAAAVPVSSIKGALAHMLGAAGAISAVAAVQAIQNGVIPPTLNHHIPDPECDLDYVPGAARHATVKHVLINAFGFGGQNACLMIAAWNGDV
jgi:3-oxoacyl-[acyl-carrier-protein] synthase II